jgi:hypothetical protein
MLHHKQSVIKKIHMQVTAIATRTTTLVKHTLIDELSPFLL